MISSHLKCISVIYCWNTFSLCILICSFCWTPSSLSGNSAGKGKSDDDMQENQDEEDSEDSEDQDEDEKGEDSEDDEH